MFRFTLLSALLSCTWIACAAQTPNPSVTSAPPKMRVLANGVEATLGARKLEVTAIRNGILRVRACNAAGFPESASWAVLAAAQSQKAAITPTDKGFSTSQLRIQIDGQLQLTITDLSGNILQQDARPMAWDGKSFQVSKRKQTDDHFFGLGDKPGPLDRAGQSFVMWNSDMFGWQETTDPLYKSIPFFIDFRAGHALGVLFDNTFRSRFDFGHALPNEYSFGAPDGPVDYYLMYGPNPSTVLEDYAFLTGPTPLPPLWSLGFQQSRYSYETEARLDEVATRLRADHIPSDALYLDIDYQVKNRPFTVNEQTFPNFSAEVAKLSMQHFHLVAITDLHIADLPNQNYAPYDSGIAGDTFVKNPDGSNYVGEVWPGPSVFPDFTRQQTRAWWGALYKQFVQDGVSGFWNDMNEPAIFGTPTKTMPDNIQHRIDEPGFVSRTTSHLEVHNIYGMENSRATYDGLLTLRPNERPFVLTRASYAGGQRYAATWTGDNSSTWNHLRMTTPQILNLGLSGFSLSGADVGGFAGSPSPDLLTKWIELAAFQPIDRDHAAKGTRDHEVWVDGPEHEAIRRRYIEERYKLMPYLYTVAEETSRNGMPINRPLFLEFPHAIQDGSPFDVNAAGEFMFGPSLLVVPNPSPEEVAPYEVRLPPGVWYDYWTGVAVEQDNKPGTTDAEQRDAVLKRKPLMAAPTLAELPVYARGGSVIPMAPLTQSTDERPVGPLTLRVYLDLTAKASDGAGTPLCGGDVYFDDGHTFNFRQGQFLREHFSCRKDADGAVTIIVGPHVGSYPPWWSTLRLEVFGLTSPVVSATSRKRSILLQHIGTSYVGEVADDPKGTELTLR